MLLRRLTVDLADNLRAPVVGELSEAGLEVDVGAGRRVGDRDRLGRSGCSAGGGGRRGTAGEGAAPGDGGGGGEGGYVGGGEGGAAGEEEGGGGDTEAAERGGGGGGHPVFGGREGTVEYYRRAGQTAVDTSTRERGRLRVAALTVSTRAP